MAASPFHPLLPCDWGKKKRMKRLCLPAACGHFFSWLFLPLVSCADPWCFYPTLSSSPHNAFMSLRGWLLALIRHSGKGDRESRGVLFFRGFCCSPSFEMRAAPACSSDVICRFTQYLSARVTVCDGCVCVQQTVPVTHTRMHLWHLHHFYF